MKSENLKYNKGDLFKREDRISHFNACIGKNGGPYSYGDYCRGYFFAAKTLAEKVISERRNLDISIYPMFYSYRHALELGLKQVWTMNSYVANGERNVIGGHNLKEIWERLKPNLLELGEIENETIDLMDNLIGDVYELDQSAEEFRFPESLKQELYNQDKSIVNTVALYEAMEVAENVIEYWFYTFNRILEREE